MSDLVWVMAACVVVWVGLFAYLVYVERQVRRLGGAVMRRGYLIGGLLIALCVMTAAFTLRGADAAPSLPTPSAAPSPARSTASWSRTAS